MNGTWVDLRGGSISSLSSLFALIMKQMGSNVLVSRIMASPVVRYRVTMAVKSLPVTLQQALVFRCLGMRVSMLPRESVVPSADTPLPGSCVAMQPSVPRVMLSMRFYHLGDSSHQYSFSVSTSIREHAGVYLSWSRVGNVLSSPWNMWLNSPPLRISRW